MTDAHRGKWAFSEAERAGVYRAIFTRRDVRAHFLPEPIGEEVLWRLLEAAHAAPSVGFMQPWRFVRIRSSELRRQLYEAVSEERIATGNALGERRDEFFRLKVEGIRECAELVAIALADDREKHIFGRRTLPEMDVASVGCAVENLWLAARAEGIGVGWVSLFDPDRVASLLEMPQGSRPMGLLCLGHVEAFDSRPALEISGWKRRKRLRDLVFEDRWRGRSRNTAAPRSGSTTASATNSARPTDSR